MIRRLLLLGASGDLTSRFLLPALAQLSAAGELPDDFSLVGAATEGWDDEGFRRHARQQLDEHAADVPAGARSRLASRLRYRVMDVTDPGSVAAALAAVSRGQGEEALAAYLALPTALIAPAVQALGAAGLPDGTRVAVEKPFGEDLNSARRLNTLLQDVLGDDWEEGVFRVDHALGMTPVRNLLPLRFTNRFPEALLNSQHVAEVDLLWEETLALEGRAGFYDRAGALKDVVQNHLMQVFCMFAMERPDGDDVSVQFSADAVGRSKVELLRSVSQLSVDDIVATSRRARYTAGRIADADGKRSRDVPDYTAEYGVDPARNTETFAELVLVVENERWSGTRFRLRAGKALVSRRKGILVRFRSSVPRGTQGVGEHMWIGVDGPNDISLTLNALSPQDPTRPGPLTMTGAQPDSVLAPYAQVLLNLLQGRSDLSVGSGEAEQAWRILDPVLDAWGQGLVPMQQYPAGSEGPS
jgi:glucose-6-phosphate 1-dehydrogenase